MKSELGRNADGENKTARRKKETDRAEALAKSVDAGQGSGQKFSINMDAFVSSIAKEDYERRFTGKMQKSVKRLEMEHHKKTMVKKGHRPLFEIPDYLK